MLEQLFSSVLVLHPQILTLLGAGIYAFLLLLTDRLVLVCLDETETASQDYIFNKF